MAESLRVVLADRSAFVRTMLRTVLSGSGFDVVAETASGAEMVPLACDLGAHVVVSDLSLADGELESFLPGLVVAGIRVVVLSDDRSPERFTGVLEAGASGYLLYDTSAEVVVEAVRAVARGAAALDPAAAGTLLHQWRRLRAREATGPTGSGRLTPRERDVLAGIVDGLSAKTIARRLGVAVKTVENHKIRIYDKLGVRTQAQAVSVAIGEGLLAGRAAAAVGEAQ